MSKFYTYTSQSATNGGGGGSGVQTVADATARLALTPTHGDLVVQLDNNTLYEYDGASWIVIGPGAGGVTVTDTNTIDLTLTGQDIEADVIYQSSDSVVLSDDASGLKADLVFQDSDTIDLSVDGSGLKADLLVQNTPSINLTAGSGGLSADLAISVSAADSGFYNAVSSVEADGLQVQVPRLWSYPGSRIIHVTKNGNDTSGTGQIDQPFLTVEKALSVITDASTTQRYFILLGPGTFTESSVVLKPWTWIVGYYRGGSRISGSNITAHSDFASGGARCGLFNIYLTGSSGLNFDFQTIGGSVSAVVEMGQVFTNNAVTFKGRSAGIDFLEWFGGGYVFGAVTFSVGSFNVSNVIFFNTVTVDTTGASNNIATVFANCDFNAGVTFSSDGIKTNSSDVFGSSFKSTLLVDQAGTTLNVDASSLRAESDVTVSNGATLVKTTSAYAVEYTPTTSGDWSTQPENVKEALDILASTVATPSAPYVSIILENNSGSTIAAEIPVCIDVNGDIIPVDVSDATANGVVGVTVSSIADGASGEVAISGKLEDLTTSLSFGPCYVSDTATLSSTVPDIGVNTFTSGDYVIKIGNVAKNQSNPSDKDLIINPQVIGKL